MFGRVTAPSESSSEDTNIDPPAWKRAGLVALETNAECDARYARVAEDADDEFLSNEMPSRTPYLRGAKMGRGAAYYKTYRQFIERGGLGHFKNAVVMNIRMNSISNLNMIEESFECEFFLDMAYWVPRFDREHHENESTLGKFAKYEPKVDFPEFLSCEWVSRVTEFSQDTHARRHECQLGQNAETHIANTRQKKPKGLAGDPKFRTAPRSMQIWKDGDGLDQQAVEDEARKKRASGVKAVVHVGDACSHWPRLWRTMVSDAELEEIRIWKESDEETQRKLAKASVPSNERPTNVHPRLKTVFKFLDEKRRRDLSHPEEGIVFCSIDVNCKVRQAYSLQDFPYDFQELIMTVRLEKDHQDPLHRYIVPVCHDKAFFCSSRVPELTEWDATKNLDWQVERGLQGDTTRDGGKQRLIAKVIVKRKHFYYTTHFVSIIFAMTTCVFSSFTLDAESQIEARSGVIFNLLLTVVAFNYCCADSVPKTPYPTTLDAFITANFIIIMVVGMVIFLFSYFAYMDVRNGDVHWVNNDDDNDGENAIGFPRFTAGKNLYSRDMETAVGCSLTGLWILGNAWYWSKVAKRVMRTTSDIAHGEQLGWLTYKKRAIPVCERQLRDVEEVE